VISPDLQSDVLMFEWQVIVAPRSNNLLDTTRVRGRNVLVHTGHKVSAHSEP